MAKKFLKSAVKARLLEKSPFADIKSAMTTNRKWQRFITEEDSQKVLQACPNAEWRLLFALSRYGALRVPSEALNLTWDDIDWANDRLHVHAPKTEHHADGGDRVIPMFTELKPLLWDVWEQAPKNSVYVIEKGPEAQEPRNKTGSHRQAGRAEGLAKSLAQSQSNPMHGAGATISEPCRHVMVRPLRTHR